MRAVYIVDKVPIAKILVDPMRRAILNLLREKPMTQAQLAIELGLSNASLNYHMKILHRHKLVVVTKSVAEEHGIIQKFFSSAAYLFVYDMDAMPKDVARYFYPVALERARAFISAMMVDNRPPSPVSRAVGYGDIDEISASMSRLFVSLARQYDRSKASYGDESVVYEIYTKVFNQFLKQQELAAGKG